MTDKLCKRCY